MEEGGRSDQRVESGPSFAPTLAQFGPRVHAQGMVEVTDFHAHIYFDAEDVDRARELARSAAGRFDLRVGRFHEKPVGPHPRGSCQLTVPPEAFGAFASWIAVHRLGLTVFAHASTGDDVADHTEHVIWFGPSEELNLSIFR